MKLKQFQETIRIFYQKLFKINDSPHEIALGLGIGVFLGVFPGAGPLAAIFLSLILHLNRASTIIGVLLTNTWISIVSFIFAVRIGAFLFGINWHDIYTQSRGLILNLKIIDLLTTSLFNIFLPVFIGYTVIALVAGLTVYLFTLLILNRLRTR